MTIAKQLKIKDFPFSIKDKDGNPIYWETSDGYWVKKEWDSDGNPIYWETSDGYWVKREFDSDGNLIYRETSNGYWDKREFDSNGNEIYWETSNGKIVDKRPKTVEFTLQEIADKLGLEVEDLRIKN